MTYFHVTLLTLSFRSTPPTFGSDDTLIIRTDKWNIRYTLSQLKYKTGYNYCGKDNPLSSLS